MMGALTIGFLFLSFLAFFLSLPLRKKNKVCLCVCGICSLLFYLLFFVFILLWFKKAFVEVESSLTRIVPTLFALAMGIVLLALYFNKKSAILDIALIGLFFLLILSFLYLSIKLGRVMLNNEKIVTSNLALARILFR